MSDSAAPSVGGLLALVARLEAALAQRDAVIAALQGEVALLRRQLGRGSSNSSRPSSSDGLGAKPARPERGASGGGAAKRMPGGQAGRRGSGLARVADPDAVVTVEPGACAGCGAHLVPDGGGRVGVFDIPPVAVTVTEYQMIVRTCGGCGHATTAPPTSGGADRGGRWHVLRAWGARHGGFPGLQ